MRLVAVCRAALCSRSHRSNHLRRQPRKGRTYHGIRMVSLASRFMPVSYRRAAARAYFIRLALTP